MLLPQHHQMMKMGYVRYNCLTAGEGRSCYYGVFEPVGYTDHSDQVHHRLSLTTGEARKIEYPGYGRCTSLQFQQP